MVDRRQQNGGSSTSASASSASSASNSASSVSAATTGTAAASASGSTSQQFGITGGPGYNPNATVSTIPANGNPGEIVFTQPPQGSTSFYKVASGEYVVFGWNYSYLAYTPTSLTISAACENGNTYPIGPSNGVIPGDAQNVTWYPYGWQTANPGLPLAQAQYTLQIFASGGISAMPTPGYLAPNDNLQFALYFPQPYTPLASGWQCSGCSGALEQFKAHPASIALFTTLLVVFLSGFTTLRKVWD